MPKRHKSVHFIWVDFSLVWFFFLNEFHIETQMYFFETLKFLFCKKVFFSFRLFGNVLDSIWFVLHVLEKISMFLGYSFHALLFEFFFLRHFNGTFWSSARMKLSLIFASIFY